MPPQDMAQPLDPLRLKGTMLDTRKVAARNWDKTGKAQRAFPDEGGEGRKKMGNGISLNGNGHGVGDAMQVE